MLVMKRKLLFYQRFLDKKNLRISELTRQVMRKFFVLVNSIELFALRQNCRNI